MHGADVSRIRSDLLLDALAEAGRAGRYSTGTPKLVAQVNFQEWTADGKLRPPVFLGLRDDKKPAECRLPEDVP